MTLLSPQECEAESPATAISRIATNTKCNLLDVDFCCAARVCAQILRLPTFTVDFTLSGALLSLSSFGTRGTSSDLRATRLVCYLFGQSVLCCRFARITILSALFFPHSIVVRRHAVWPRNKPQLGQPNRGSSLPALLHRRRSKIGGRQPIFDVTGTGAVYRKQMWEILYDRLLDTARRSPR